MVLSDRTIARLLEEGRIEIDPYDPSLLQPSSVDVRVDRFFRVFRNNLYPFIDVKVEQEGLTELVEVGDEPFILHPGEFVLGSTLERVKLPDDLVARLEGKALALDTPIPTTQGWRAMGDLEPGDLVFDEDGFPTVVLAATPPMNGRPCREVVFSDGTTVVADTDHLWRTVSRRDRDRGDARGRLVTTVQIERSLRAGGGWNHHLPPVGAARLPSGRREATRGALDAGGVLAAALARPSFSDPPGDSPRTRRAPGPRRRAEMARLQRVLVVAAPGAPGLSGVRDTAVRDSPGRREATGLEHRRRAIVDVREIDSVPVRCIEVSSPNGMFLVTRSFIPTHNSSLGRLGLLIHSTAGFVDPGWDGHVTLELSNVANLPITIYPEMKIGQLSFMRLTEPAAQPYGAASLGSKYQGQRGPTPSRYWRNFAPEEDAS